MRLSMFRKKLAYEIIEVEGIIQNSNYANQEVQAHFYCIATLLRKITTRLTRFNGFQIPVISGAERSISLKDLTDKILHYSKFLPGHSRSTPYETLRTIAILSDWDECLNPWRREIEVTDFIQLAKKIAEEDEAILPDVLSNAKVNLEKVIHLSPVDPLSSIEQVNRNEARESLIDFFELAHKMEYENWPSGRITLFLVIMKSMTEVKIKTNKINYDIFCQKFLNVWFFTPIGAQFDDYSGHVDELKSHKTISLENPDRERVFQGYSDVPYFMIRAQDLLNLLCAIQQ